MKHLSSDILSYVHGACDVPLIGETIGDLFDRVSEKIPDNEALIEIVAVKLEPCAVDEDPFLGKLQRLAPKFRSVAEAPLKSSAWEQVRKDLLPVIKRVRAKKEKAAAAR